MERHTTSSATRSSTPTTISTEHTGTAPNSPKALDVAYVGNLGRHLGQSYDLNALPSGTRFLPQNQDPTAPGSPLSDNFLRTYVGWFACVAAFSFLSEAMAARLFLRLLVIRFGPREVIARGTGTWGRTSILEEGTAYQSHHRERRKQAAGREHWLARSAPCRFRSPGPDDRARPTCRRE